jgi:hypothetical protein
LKEQAGAVGSDAAPGKTGCELIHSTAHNHLDINWYL